MGSDQIGDCLGLGKVKLAVEKGTEGELPGPGKPGALFYEQFKYLLLDIHGAMAGDLNDIFPGIGVWIPEDADQGFVQDIPFSPDESVMDRMGSSIPDTEGSPYRGENRFTERESLLAR
jgi:hypothetical protein